MSKHRTPPRYATADAIEVYVGDRKYFVFLDAEIVVTEVSGHGGKAVLRRVTSRAIETAAILKASDKANAEA